MYQYTNIFGAFSRARPPRKISKKKIIDTRFHGLPAAAGFFFWPHIACLYMCPRTTTECCLIYMFS